MSDDATEVLDSPKRKRGRPRDANMESRLLGAAISLFGSRGWAGFSIEQVARIAKVGKGTVYLRWPSAEALLREALQKRLRFVDDPDTGQLRTDLLSLAQQLAEVYGGENGRAFLRIYLEGDVIPGFEEYWEFQQDQMRVARRILRRGEARGEVGNGIRVTTLLDALSGGILIHTLTAPAPVVASEEATTRVLEELVELVLAGAALQE
ncbi:TetR/AcrR family transcriptional regulator [Nocardioides sp. CPCC 206347]|uniref:TetR/AcrR family transcriptional regulator n=3 Tax=Nocardioides TaxID=1839 RepID=UPI003B42A319